MRERLPDRRPVDTFVFEHAGFVFTAGVGRYADGRPAEIFLSAGKDGTALAIAVSDQAILASLALQHGVPLDTLRHALSRAEDGAPAGPVLVALDRIAREDADAVLDPAWRPEEPPPAMAAAVSPSSSRGLTGEVCRWCESHNVIRTGTCITCLDCGSNNGCS